MQAVQAQPQVRAPSLKAQTNLGRILGYTILIGGGLLMTLPFFWLASSSLKTPGNIYVFPPQWIPDPARWENYIETFEMTIYDRWGQQVYSTEDVNKPWDGKVNGADLVTGVYVYKFKAAGHLFPSTEGYGHVTLLGGSDGE